MGYSGKKEGMSNGIWDIVERKGVCPCEGPFIDDSIPIEKVRDE
jgi:hypothetical protein